MTEDHRDTELLRPPESKKDNSSPEDGSAGYRETEDDSAVWTSAERIPYQSALPPEVEPPEADPVEAAPQKSKEAPDETEGQKLFQFRRFMEDLSSMEQPAAEVEGLSRFASDGHIVKEAVLYLEEVAREHVSRGNLVEELIYGMAGVVHLRAVDGRAVLESMVRRALEQLEGVNALPQLEEHFALAAMEGLKGGEFSTLDLFDEYDAMVGQTADIMDRDGEAAAVALVAYHAGRYRERIRDILGMTPAPRAVDAVPSEPRATESKTAEPVAPIAAPQTLKRVPQTQEPVQKTTPSSSASDDPYGRLNPSARATLQIEPELYEDVTGTDFAPRGQGLPWFMSLSALMAGGAGLAFAILSYKLGFSFLAIGILWIAGAIGLVMDRKPGFFFGISTFLINGAFLVWSGLATQLPVWLAPAGLLVTGGVAMMVGLLLLHPNLRSRFHSQAW